MPVDKFGIPFLYPTKQTAGITGSGHGFFWEQNNNFRNDENSGFLRLGKETDQCVLISSTTGEWEFPFLSSGDGLSVSGGTGHHSGGETHGCEGFAYMVDGNFDANPPTFRFRKETYHVQYNTDPINGTWTSPFATGPVANNWKGIGWVRYNKENGRPDGGDSVVCECWWNDDPVTDIKNWKMLKRVEDKGAGVTNWGVPATCDGSAYQVGTWSAIQFRWKSAASDFSLHPIRPEFNEGDDIHAIGGKDMSFADSEARGYSLQADIPRDIEMKGLFKWDAGGDGKCRFKNLSLREIDPTISFDDNTGGGTPDDPPSEETSTIVGSFKLQWDVNNIRVSPCAGAGTGGGGGSGNAIFWTIPATYEKPLSNTSTFGNVIFIGEVIKGSSSTLNGKLPIQMDIPLKKSGSPAATPLIYAIIVNSASSVIYSSPTTVDPTTLTTSFVKKTFDFSTNTHTLVTGDRIGVYYDGTSATDYVIGGYDDGTSALAVYTVFGGGAWEEISTRDFAADIWQ